jgi:hypothetical protein
MASVLEEKKRLSAQTTQTASVSSDKRSSTSSTASASTAHSTIEMLPIRASSLGRSLNLPSIIHEVMPPVQAAPAPTIRALPQPIRAAPTPAPAPVHLPTPVAEPRLRKEKTKSKVWGFLGKKVKAKEPMSPDFICEYRHLPC